MCFSIKISKNTQNLSKLFHASASVKDFSNLQSLLKLQEEMNQVEFEKALGLSNTRKRPTPFRLPNNDDRVFPGYFANVITSEQGNRLISPMRYRVRPQGSREEIPDKFGVYNARIDSLMNKQTWIPLFGRKHGLVPFVNFYEWVLDPEEKKDLGLFNLLDEDNKKELGDNPNARKRLISFHPENGDIMWAPCLWDEWISEKGEISFKSFAIITDNPPPEVLIMGHDRCPVFLKEDLIDEWLTPEGKTKKDLIQILGQKENQKFYYKWAY